MGTCFKRDHAIVYDLGKDQITDWLRVSSTALAYESYWQVETWIFSAKEELQNNIQVIHGTIDYDDDLDPTDPIIARCHKIHNHMVENLKKDWLKK